MVVNVVSFDQFYLRPYVVNFNKNLSLVIKLHNFV